MTQNRSTMNITNRGQRQFQNGRGSADSRHEVERQEDDEHIPEELGCSTAHNTCFRFKNNIIYDTFACMPGVQCQ